MSGTELLVIVFGLVIGYWLVSHLGSGAKTQPPPHTSHAEAEAQRRQAQAEREAQDARHRQQHAENPGAADPAAWHTVLNVAPDAPLQEIRRAYKTLMSQYHPDKVAALGPELRELCERKTKEINTAYDRAMAERGTA